LEVSRLQADLAFYAQTLTGDQSDNYPGCPKVGEVGARRLLEGLQTEQEMWAAVLSAFRKAGLDDRYALAQARCARILRPEDYDLAAQVVRPWVPPVG
jgi:DNA polymerase-1